MKMINIKVAIETEKDEVTKMQKRQVPWMGDIPRVFALGQNGCDFCLIYYLDTLSHYRDDVISQLLA